MQGGGRHEESNTPRHMDKFNPLIIRRSADNHPAWWLNFKVNIQIGLDGKAKLTLKRRSLRTARKVLSLM